MNKITPDNMGPLTERFKALPIDTMERLEKTIDLVFEKVIFLQIAFIVLIIFLYQFAGKYVNMQLFLLSL